MKLFQVEKILASLPVNLADSALEWSETFASSDFPSEIDNASDCLPGGFASYSLLLHGLSTDQDTVVESASTASRWVQNTGKPWNQVKRVLAEIGRGEVKANLSRREHRAVVEALEIRPDKEYAAGFFIPFEDGMHSRRLDGALLDVCLEHELCTVWFPLALNWIACSPYDGCFTYIGSDVSLYVRLRQSSELEVLPCAHDSLMEI